MILCENIFSHDTETRLPLTPYPKQTISTKQPDMEYNTLPEAARAIRGTQKTVLFMCLYIIYIYNIYIQGD